MIYVRVELWPGGDENHPRKQVLAEARIANITGGDSTADYAYRLTGKSRSPMGKGTVCGFPRKRLMAWDLLFRVLHDARGERNR